MSISYVKLFNQHMDNFFNELINIFPEEKKIKVNYSLFQTVYKANAKKPLTDFMSMIIPYLEMIAMRDETIFTGEYSPDILKKINFERLWNDDLSVNTKTAIWNYIKTFIEIGFNVVETPVEKHELIKYIISQ